MGHDDASDVTYTISELADFAGVNVETVRYYERRGLLRKPKKPMSGWRRYGPEARATLGFIVRAKELGFKLDEVASLLKMRVSQNPTTCARVKQRAERKMVEIDAKLRDLTAIRGALADLVGQCGRGEDSRGCAVLTALEPRDASPRARR